MNYQTEQEIIARIRENKDWYGKSYAGYFFGIFEQGQAIGQGTNHPLAIPYGILFQNWSRPHHMDWFWDSQEMRQKRQLVLERAINDSQFAAN